MVTALFCLVLAIGAMGAVGMMNVPLAWLLGIPFILQIRQDFWSVGGVMFDGFDLGLACIVIALLRRSLPRASLKRLIPRFTLWLWLAVLLCASYAVSPAGQSYMTDPLRGAYQLYRYALRFVILYPVACLVLDTPKKFDKVRTAIVLAADICAAMSFAQGYSGGTATGPFTTKNGLGGALAVPVVIVAADMIRGNFTGFTVVSAALLLRSALFAASRGAFAGVIVGSATAWWFMFHGRVRTRLVALVMSGAFGIALLLAVNPDITHRPTIAKFFTTFDPGQQTLSWRIHERWPYFTHRALQKPWLGWGSDVDLSLGPKANTPHNGYLGLANNFGFPALLLYVGFAVLTLRDSWTVSQRGEDRADRVRAATIGGAIACILTHNIVDSVILMTFVGGELWVFAAVAAMLARQTRAARAARTVRAPAYPALALGARP